MADMYEKVLAPQQRKTPSGKGKLLLIVAIAVAVLLACIIPVARTLTHQYRYKQFIVALSSQTTQAYDKGNLRAEVDGLSLRVTGDNAYMVYNTMVALKAGQIAGHRPQEDPDATLYYGDEAVMKLWDVPLSGSNGHSNGVYVEFDSPSYDFSYVINGKDIRYFMIALSPDQNPLWDE